MVGRRMPCGGAPRVRALAPLLRHSAGPQAVMETAARGRLTRSKCGLRKSWRSATMPLAEELRFLVGHSMGGLVSIVAAALYGAERLAGRSLSTRPYADPIRRASKAQAGRAFRQPRRIPIRDRRAHFRLIPEQPCSMDSYLTTSPATPCVKPHGWTWKFIKGGSAGPPQRRCDDYLVPCAVALL